MKFKSIETFLALAETLNFNKAADRLHCSQSTVTVQIQALEKELGVVLFERLNKTVSLTEQGNIFLAYARKVLSDTDHIMKDFQNKTVISGELRIAAWQSVNMFILPPILSAYQEKYPNVSITIIEPTNKTLFEYLAKNEADFAFVIDEPYLRNDIAHVLRKQEPLSFFVHPDHPLAVGKEIRPQSLRGETFLLGARNFCYNAILHKYLNDLNINIHVALESGNTEQLRILAESGRGIIFLPRFTVQNSLDSGRLVEIKVKGFHPTAERQVFYHSNKWVSPQIQAMLSMILQSEES